jgi:hypothetical protein
MFFDKNTHLGIAKAIQGSVGSALCPIKNKKNDGKLRW